MRTGLSEEANPAALWGMNVIGVDAYVILASVLSLLLALPVFVRPRTLLPTALCLFGTAFVAGKAYIGVTNLQILLA